MSHRPRIKLARETIDAVMKAELKGESLQQFRDLAVKKDETKLQFNVAKEQQTSGIKGFRIIGVIKNANNLKGDPIGYVLFNDAKQETCQYSVQQVKMILGMHKFVNAVLENDKVVITDGAEAAMLQFDANLNPVGTPSIYILSRATETVKANGQTKTQEILTFIDHRLKINKLASSTVIEAKNQGKINLANMKVVTTAGGTILEAKNVDTIPTYEKEIKPEQVKSDDAEAFRKQQLKMKNHASFVQRILDYIENCIFIQYSKNPSKYTTKLHVFGMSQLHRGLSMVGCKGLTAIMEREVFPLLEQKYDLDFTAVISEIRSSADLRMEFFTGWDVKYALNTPERLLFLKYLYALRHTPKVYKILNIYDVVKAYNARPHHTAHPYIVGNDYELERTLRSMTEDKTKYPYRMPTFKEHRKVIANRITGLTSIVCNGTAIMKNSRILWPMPFEDCDASLSLLNALPTDSKQYAKMILHICSEASLFDAADAGEESFYRRNRIICMTAALLTAVAATSDESTWHTTATILRSLLGDVSKQDIVPDVMYSPNYYNAIINALMTVLEEKGAEHQTMIFNRIKCYSKAAGLLVPYFSAMNKPAKASAMHWHAIMTSINNDYYTKRLIDNFPINSKFVTPCHKYGMLWVIDTSLREGCNIDIKYNVSPNSRHYQRLKNHRLKKTKTGLKVWTPLTAVESRAAIAQYLGRPYRAKNPYYDPHMLRLVYYVNTYAPENGTHTHDLY